MAIWGSISTNNPIQDPISWNTSCQLWSSSAFHPHWMGSISSCYLEFHWVLFSLIYFFIYFLLVMDFFFLIFKSVFHVYLVFFFSWSFVLFDMEAALLISSCIWLYWFSRVSSVNVFFSLFLMCLALFLLLFFSTFLSWSSVVLAAGKSALSVYFFFRICSGVGVAQLSFASFLVLRWKKDFDGYFKLPYIFTNLFLSTQISLLSPWILFCKTALSSQDSVLWLWFGG